jgi:hypothetical protein
VTDAKRHDVPLEPDNEPGRRSGEGAGSVLPHLQQQVQSKPPPELEPALPGAGPADTSVDQPD